MMVTDYFFAGKSCTPRGREKVDRKSKDGSHEESEDARICLASGKVRGERQVEKHMLTGTSVSLGRNT